MFEQLQTAAQLVAAEVAPSTVSVGQDGRGSGFVVAENRVLTNAHNLRDRTTLITFADGRAEQAKTKGVDPIGDLVVVEVPTGDVAPLHWATEPAALGDVVFAVSRGGHRARVSFGLVAAVEQPFVGPRGREVQGGIEHTAPLPRGSSGGPLVDSAGRVVAVNTHRVGNGFYLARPMDAALRARVDELAEGRSVEPPSLGVALAPSHVASRLRRSVGLPEREGLLVRGVVAASPAARAGIGEGDLLVNAGGQALAGASDLHRVLEPLSVGDSLEIGLVRGVDEITVTVTLGDAAPAEEPAPAT